MANVRNRKEQRFLAFGVDVLGLLLESREWVVEGEGCYTLKVDSTFLSHLFNIYPEFFPIVVDFVCRVLTISMNIADLAGVSRVRDTSYVFSLLTYIMKDTNV